MWRAISNWAADVLGRKKYQRYREKETRRRRILGQVFALLNVPCALFYLIWCVLYADWSYWYVFVPFVLCEIFFLIHYLLWIHLLWYKRHHRPDGLGVPKELTVDVFIPVCGEPVEIIARTVAAANALEYPKKIVHLLDDGEDDRVKELARASGVDYIRRPTHENRKAGNLNYALKCTNSDLVLTIDADQVVEPHLLRSVVGYFTIPRIAFVQTEQRFILPENDPWGNSDAVFYKSMQSGKDNDNAAISCGNGAIYLRKALEDVGGFSEWNLVEDLHTSMLLHDRGWKSVYHDTPLSTGHAPQDILTQIKQRWQWAVDSLRLFFWDSPLRRSGLSLSQKMQYFHFGYNYISFGFCLPIFFLLPTWALFTHNFMLKADLLQYALVRLPYFIAYTVTNKLLTDGLNNFKVFQCQAGNFAIYFSAVLTALRCRNHLPRYTVTSKVANQLQFFQRLYACLPHIIISLLALSAIVYGIMTIHDDLWFLAVNLLWAFWTIAALSRFIILSLVPRILLK